MGASLWQHRLRTPARPSCSGVRLTAHSGTNIGLKLSPTPHLPGTPRMGIRWCGPGQGRRGGPAQATGGAGAPVPAPEAWWGPAARQQAG